MVYGRTKTEVRDRLKKLKEKLDAEQDNGPEASSPPVVTVRECAETWLAEGLNASAQTIQKNRDCLRPVLEATGNGEPRALTLATAAHGGPSQVVLRLPRHAPLVEVARERVTATTLASAPLLSGDRVCGWLTARRPPGSDQVRWVLALQDATAAGDPALASRVSEAIAALEADLGLASWRPPGWPGS